MIQYMGQTLRRLPIFILKSSEKLGNTPHAGEKVSSPNLTSPSMSYKSTLTNLKSLESSFAIFTILSNDFGLSIFSSKVTSSLKGPSPSLFFNYIY